MCQGTFLELWEPDGNTLETCWEHSGNTLGTGEKQTRPPPPPQNPKQENYLNLIFGCMKLLCVVANIVVCNYLLQLTYKHSGCI